MGLTTTTRKAAKTAARKTITGKDTEGILTLPGSGPRTMREGEAAPGMRGKEMTRVTAKQRLYLEAIAKTTSKSKQGVALRKQARAMLDSLGAAKKKYGKAKTVKKTVGTGTITVKGKGKTKADRKPGKAPTYRTKTVTPKAAKKKKS